MKAIVLAAREGPQMRSPINARPNVMFLLANKPTLEHLLIQAIKAGVTDCIFVVGYHDDLVRNYFVMV